MAYVTPENAPESYDCRALFVPAGQSWWAILTGALYSLTLASSYEQVTGLTPEETAEVFSEMFRLWDEGECPMFAGMIVPAACANAPSARWLACDGASYLRTDYPALFTAIGTAFGSVDGTHFNVPDLMGRSPIGVGSGSGLTPRSLADSGGAEEHTLAEAEMPSHLHGIPWMTYAGATGGGAGPYFQVNVSSVYYTSDAGGDEPHNNMPPFLALNFFIYTG